MTLPLKTVGFVDPCGHNLDQYLSRPRRGGTGTSRTRMTSGPPAPSKAISRMSFGRAKMNSRKHSSWVFL